ncbi:acyltransfersase-like [Tropilaelaps mercedesae]|uniref:Acyltransfersase-like n=1 Tax=Tropilaelaps mercedesae TaxID=418985 RepID=A0A1V9XZD9_9ACAR|nr:acyltransfersase-like [Tropilaelaps mercedesae]
MEAASATAPGHATTGAGAAQPLDSSGNSSGPTKVHVTGAGVGDRTAADLSALLNATTLNGDDHHDSRHDLHNHSQGRGTASSSAPSPNSAQLNDQRRPEPSSTPPAAASVDKSRSVPAPTERPPVSPPPYPAMPFNVDGIKYIAYESELQMPAMMELFQKDLSEPYSIYTYRYFIHNWPKLCFLAMDEDTCVGAIVCKLDAHKKRDAVAATDAVGGGHQQGHGRVQMRGYIAMLAVEAEYRKRKIASNLVLTAIRAMVANQADEVVLETEITNQPALRLYENLGFVRDKRLFRYYLNGVDAFRLKLWLR